MKEYKTGNRISDVPATWLPLNPRIRYIYGKHLQACPDLISVATIMDILIRNFGITSANMDISKEKVRDICKSLGIMGRQMVNDIISNMVHFGQAYDPIQASYTMLDGTVDYNGAEHVLYAVDRKILEYREVMAMERARARERKITEHNWDTMIASARMDWYRERCDDLEHLVSLGRRDHADRNRESKSTIKALAGHLARLHELRRWIMGQVYMMV